MHSDKPDNSRCRYCAGTGRTPSHRIAPPPQKRGNAGGPMPPFGVAVAQRARAETVPAGGVDIFIRPCPVTGLSAWDLAKNANEQGGPGSAMVLPMGADPGVYRWPAIPLQFEGQPVVVVWAFGMTGAEETFVGESLIAAGYDLVDMRGGPSGPLRFKVSQ